MQGYIAAKADAPPQLDRTAHLVSYSFSVAPGAQYHLKTLRWSGLNEAQQQALESHWRMSPGSVYDATYPLKFVRDNLSLIPLGAKAGIELHANPSDATVDLVMNFGRNPPSPQ